MSDEEDIFSKKERRTMRKIARAKDRSKFKKSDVKKRKKTESIKTQALLSKKQELLRGRVLALFPEGVSVEYQGSVVSCTLRGALKKERGRAKTLLAVGDFVLFEPDGAIAHIEKRRSELTRKEHRLRRKKQVIAANIDQVLITTSIDDPPLKPSLVDRYIIATRKGNMAPVIVVNKIDLLKKEDRLFFKDFCLTYEALHIPLIALSATTNEGLERLKKQMRGRSSVFSGQSGVGKSSLINAMTGLDLPTKEVAKKTRKGSHTTSRTHLVPLPFGGWCIDTPGIRSFGLWELTKEDLTDYFPHIAETALKCKYPNCSHTHEPDCAVQDSVARGTLSALRFRSYAKLLEEVDR